MPRHFSTFFFAVFGDIAKMHLCTKFQVSSCTRFGDTLGCTPKFMGSRDLGHTRFLHILCEFLRYWELKELLKGNVNMTTRKRLLNCYVFSVLKYGCESWTVNKNLMKRINAFEQWCYRRMLEISWKDKVPLIERF